MGEIKKHFYFIRLSRRWGILAIVWGLLSGFGHGGCVYSTTPPPSSGATGGGVQSGSLPSDNQFTQSVGSTGIITSGSITATLTISPMAIQGLRTTTSLSFSDPGLERAVRQLTSESSQP